MTPGHGTIGVYVDAELRGLIEEHRAKLDASRAEGDPITSTGEAVRSLLRRALWRHTFVAEREPAFASQVQQARDFARAPREKRWAVACAMDEMIEVLASVVEFTVGVP